MAFSGYYFTGYALLPSHIITGISDFGFIDTFTVNVGSDVITVASPHFQIADEVVQFTTTGTLPSPLIPFHNYRVLSSGLTATQLQISETVGGAVIDITDAGTGVHSFWIRPLQDRGNVTAVAATDILTLTGKPTLFEIPNVVRMRFTTTGTLPAPLVVGNDYFALNSTGNDFQINNGGSPLNITTAGTGTHSLQTIVPVLVQYPFGEFGYQNDEAYYMLTGGIEGGGVGDAINLVNPPQTREVVRDAGPSEVRRMLDRARRAAKIVENLSIAGTGVAGSAEDGFSIN